MKKSSTPLSLAFACIALIVGALSIPSPARSADSPGATSTEIKADIVVFGGTSAGITSAVAAGRTGASVVLVEPSYGANSPQVRALD